MRGGHQGYPACAGKHADMLGRCCGGLVGDPCHTVMAAGCQADTHNPDAVSMQKWFIIIEREREDRKEGQKRDRGRREEAVENVHLMGKVREREQNKREEGEEYFLYTRTQGGAKGQGFKG